MGSEKRRLSKKYKSSTHYILSGLIPYTEANLKLSFTPNRFFNDLEKLDQIKLSKNSIKTNYYRLINKGFIEIDETGIPRLTKKGRASIQKYQPKKLSKNARLLIIFDIPENQKYKRDRLRMLLRELSFKPVQKSVWGSEYDYRDYLSAEIKDYALEDYVVLYESVKLKI